MPARRSLVPNLQIGNAVMEAPASCRFRTREAGASENLVPKLELSSLYTSIFKPVIPAWMPESSHRDVKVRRHPALLIDMRGSGKLPSMALDTGIHAGMTTLGQTCV